MAEEIGFQVNVKGGESLASLKKEFKDLQKELEKAEVGTAEYQRTLEKLGAVKDDIGDLRDTISALNPEGKVAAFQNVAGKLAGGFQAATGAAALFGAKSEELEKTLLKVQAATALAQGIQSVTGLSDAFAVLGTVIKANPIFFVATAITGIVAALALYNREEEKAVGTTDELNKSIKTQNDLFKEQNEIIDLNNSLVIENLKQKGATSKQINEEILRQNQETLNRLREQEAKATQLRITQENSNKEAFALLYTEGNKNQIKLNQDKLAALVANEKEYADKRADFEKKATLQAAQIKTQEVEADRQRRKEADNKALQDKKKNAVEYETFYVDEVQMFIDGEAKKAEAEQNRLKTVAQLEQEAQAIRVANFQQEEALRKKKEADEKAQLEAKSKQKITSLMLLLVFQPHSSKLS